MKLGKMDEQDVREWEEMIDLNIKGVLYGIKCVVRGMKERRKGCIINMSSVAGLKNYENHTVYCSTKFAVQGITEGLRQELANSNVKVVAICPGIVETNLIHRTTNEKYREEYQSWKDDMERGVLMPEDIANACFYAYKQPPRCCIREIVLAPTNQDQ